MNGGIGNEVDPGEVEETLDSGEDQSADNLDETIVIESDDNVDNVGDLSVEINVDELVARIESDDDGETDSQREVKRRLDELKEQKRRDEALEGTYNFNLDDDD